MTLVGHQLQVSPGRWSGSPTSYSYQWQSSPDGVTGWADIAAATRSDYIAQAGDIGNYVRCGVVARNAGGSSSVSYSVGTLISATGDVKYVPISRTARRGRVSWAELQVPHV